MKARFGLLIASLGLLAVAAPVFAHHSFAAEYDKGTITNWELELGSPNGLARRGWTRNSMKPGDQVVVDGYMAKDGSNLANARNVKLADGRKLFAGSTDDGSPQK